MEPNTHSSSSPGRPRPGGPSDRLASLTADVDELASEDLNTLTDVALVEEALELRRLVDRLEGQWLQRLAAIDAWAAAGAEQGIQAPSTASWLRNRLQMGASAATSAVRSARALFRGPLTGTAAALTAGEISVAHASALTHGTSDLPAQVAAEAEPVLLEAARRMDPPRLRRVLGHLQQVADPDGADRDSERRHGRRGRWLAPTFAGMVALQGLLEAEAGHIVLAALEPLARPTAPRTSVAVTSAALMPSVSWPAATRRAASSPPGSRRPWPLLPPILGGAPRQPLDVGRASRVITPAQRSAPGGARRWLCLP